MKAPLNTDNWSGSIKSDKAPLNTDDWNGFISADMSRKLSQNCQCIKAPCNCGAIKKVPIKWDRVLDNFKPRSEDTIRGIFMSLGSGSLSDEKRSEIGRKLNRLNQRDLSNLYAIIQKEENDLQKLNLVYQAIAKADNDRLIKEKENQQELSEGFQRRIMPKLRKLESMAREGKVDMQSYAKFIEVYKAKLRDGEITLEQYEKQFELKVNELLGIKDPSKKNDKLLIYGLIAVAGYLIYKKFKK
jgi:hypothetical protein